MAQILHGLAHRRKGHLGAVTRDKLVGQYIGHTAHHLDFPPLAPTEPMHIADKLLVPQHDRLGEGGHPLDAATLRTLEPLVAVASRVFQPGPT
jgi:hypothetical protein